MLGPDEWSRLSEDWASLGVHTSDRRLVAAVLDIHDRLEAVEADSGARSQQEALDRRAEALRQAREHVNGMPSEQLGPRGYRDKAVRSDERIALEIRVAAYLLGEAP